MPEISRLLQQIHKNRRKEEKSIPEEYFYQKLIELLEQNIDSMLHLIELPYVNDQNRLAKNHFFPELIKTMYAAIPEKYRERLTLQIYLGPEIVKALLAKIYQDLYESIPKVMADLPQESMSSVGSLGDFLKKSLDSPEYHLRKNYMIHLQPLLGAYLLAGSNSDVFFEVGSKEGIIPLISKEEIEKEIEPLLKKAAEDFITSADRKYARKKRGERNIFPYFQNQ